MTLTTEGFTIRPMDATDIEWAKRLADGLPEAPYWTAMAYQSAIDPGAMPRRIALVAELASAALASGYDDRRLGFCIAGLVPPEAELETVVVSASARRRGVGRALMAALGAGLKREGVTEVILEVRASNAGALALYASMGFRETGRRVRYYVDPVEDAILMGWAL